ncbi:16S rRNA (guanine(966)-N(2))-methyltransferase RsmD [Candidatus Vidania fulgoroideorum]
MIKVRIISGKYSSLKINFKRIVKEKIRPTKTIIRKSFFDIVGKKIIGSKCLDLFCGTGSLGLEACSRGAKEVTLIDINRKPLKTIRKFINKFKITNVEVINESYIKFLRRSKDLFDFIFIDPPYSSYEKYSNIVKASEKNLKKGGTIFLENYKKNMKGKLNFENFTKKSIGSRGKILFLVLEFNK